MLVHAMALVLAGQTAFGMTRMRSWKGMFVNVILSTQFCFVMTGFDWV